MCQEVPVKTAYIKHVCMHIMQTPNVHEHDCVNHLNYYITSMMFCCALIQVSCDDFIFRLVCMCCWATI